MTKLKLTGPAMLVTVLVSLPALQHGLIDHTLSMQNMLIRLGLATFFSMIALSIVSTVVDTYRLQNTLHRNREEVAAALRQADEDAAKRSST
jgi:hypothetical protein